MTTFEIQIDFQNNSNPAHRRNARARALVHCASRIAKQRNRLFLHRSRVSFAKGSPISADFPLAPLEPPTNSCSTDFPISRFFVRLVFSRFELTASSLYSYVLSRIRQSSLSVLWTHMCVLRCFRSRACHSGNYIFLRLIHAFLSVARFSGTEELRLLFKYSLLNRTSVYIIRWLSDEQK